MNGYYQGAQRMHPSMNEVVRSFANSNLSNLRGSVPIIMTSSFAAQSDCHSDCSSALLVLGTM